jgi:hypothetical protein
VAGARPNFESGPVENTLAREVDTPAEQVMAVDTSGVSVAPARANPGRERLVGDTLAQRVERARGSGERLDDTLRTHMEASFRSDFSDVRIHMGEDAAALNRELQARAFTIGNDVFLAHGKRSTDISTMAHELTHVLQQRMGSVSGTDTGRGFAVSSPDDHFERHAEEVARDIVSAHVRNRAGYALQQASTQCHVPPSIQRLVIQRDGDPDGPQNDPDWQAGHQDGINGAASDPGSRTGDALQSYNDGYAKGSYDSAQQGGQTYTPAPAPQPGAGGSSVAVQQDQQAYQAGYDDGANNRPYDYYDQATVLGLGYEQDYQNGYNQGQTQWQAQHPTDVSSGPAVGPAEGPSAEEPSEEPEKPDEAPTYRPEYGRYIYLKNLAFQRNRAAGLGVLDPSVYMSESERQEYERLFQLYGAEDEDPVPVPAAEVEVPEEEEELQAE